MIVEFAGISGSGKTTALKKFIRASRKNGLRISKFHRVARELDLPQHQVDISFEAKFPGLQRKLQTLGKNTAYELNNAAIARTVWVAGTQRVKQHTLSAIDEGFVHRAAYIAAAGLGKEAFLSILPSLPRPDILIHVDVPLDVAKERYISRKPEGRKRQRAENLYQARLEDHQKAQSYLTAARHRFEDFGVTTFLLDNTVGLETQISRIAKSMSEQIVKTDIAA
ncbi:MAG: hypothetical protein AAGK67_10015 [Pseudomonadota bacterium]